MPGIWRDFQEDLQLPHGKWSSKVKEHSIFQWRFERNICVIYAVEEFEGRWVLTAKMLWVIFLDIYRHAFVQYLTHAYCPSCPTMQYKWSLVLPPSSILHWSFWSWTMHMLSANIRRPDTPQNFSKYLMFIVLSCMICNCYCCMYLTLFFLTYFWCLFSSRTYFPEIRFKEMAR